MFQLTVDNIGSNALSTPVIVQVLGESAEVQLGTVGDTGQTPGSSVLSGDVAVGESVVDAVEEVLSVDSLVSLDVSYLGRRADSFEGVGGEFTGCGAVLA